MKKNVNIKDIAKLSGVGVSTVSRVLNDHKDVKKETK
ncbi:MAG: LacI family DNA-binding transcriptional regulator, partial [Acidaminobacteraceae bacterium]